MRILEVTKPGIPRSKMPQIHIDDIKGKFKYKLGKISLDKMTPVQTERLEKDSIEAKNKILSGTAKPIMLDKSGNIVNGHHRYDAYKELGHKKVPAVLVDATLSELMQTYSDTVEENFADGKVKGKSRPGRVKRAGASCNGSVTDLRAKAKKYSGERGKMYHWCANMKGGKKK